MFGNEGKVGEVVAQRHQQKYFGRLRLNLFVKEVFFVCVRGLNIIKRTCGFDEVLAQHHD
jgi:hypothetical protein